MKREELHQDLSELGVEARREALREASALTRNLSTNGRAGDDDLILLAHLLQKGGRPRDSLQVLRRLLTRSPRHLLGHFLTARAQELLGEHRLAAEGYQLVHGWAPPWPEPLRRRARCLRALGETEDYHRTSEAYLSRRRDDPEAHRELAYSYLSHARPGAAVPHLQWIVDRPGASARDHESLGVALERAGRSGEAAGRYQIALGLDAREPRPGLRLARLRFQRGEYELSREACARLLSHHANLEPALSLATECALRTGDQDRALASMERLLKLRPQDPELRTRYAEILLTGGETREAGRQLQRVVDRFPRHDRAVLRLAELRREEGDLGRARDLFGRVLAADPGQPLALLRVGQLALEEGNPRAAIQPLRRLVLRCPANPRAHRELGMALRRAERGKDARTHLERCLELSPRDAVACLELGHLLREMQALNGAEAAYRRTLEIAPGSEEATRAAYELSHLRPEPAKKEGPPRGVVVPLRPRRGTSPAPRDAGLVAPPGNWTRTA